MPLLLCDLDDTLIDRAGAFRRWAADFAADHGIPDEGLAWMLDLDNDGHVHRPDYLAAVRERFRLPMTQARLESDYHRVYPEYVRPPAAETLAALRDLRAEGWRVGVVTNGAPSQEAKMRHAGLVDCLDGWAISDVVGVRKPNPAIFRAAAERCAGTEPGWSATTAPPTSPAPPPSACPASGSGGAAGGRTPPTAPPTWRTASARPPGSSAAERARGPVGRRLCACSGDRVSRPRSPARWRRS